MVRWVSFVAVLCLCCAACSPSAATPVSTGFRCQTTIQYGETEYVGTFDRTDPYSAVLTLSKPQTVSGLTMRLNDTDITVQYLGMEMKVSEDTLPISSVVRVLCDTLDAAVQNGNVNGSSVIEGDSACGKFTLRFDEESGRPCSLEIPAIAFAVDFSAWETPKTE